MLLEEKPLLNKIAVVTGASRGIGKAIALKLSQMGAYVIVNYCFSEEKAKETLEMIKSLSPIGGELARADVGNADEAKQLIDSVLTNHDHVDILINNAGINLAALVHKMTDEQWHKVINTNLSSVFYLCRAVLPSMIARGSGDIINIGSASGFMGHTGAASYVASKHALTGLTKVLAIETATKGIRVNTVAPGLTQTDMVDGLSEEACNQLKLLVPMKRIADTKEIANLVGAILVSATYSTGNTFHASGGVIMG